jgi:pyruvate ferredoxin oxidoreductase alpha subunit
MRRQIEGSRAVAETVARCRPLVIPAYPISPQTHIVEALSELVKSGALAPCEFINAESEFGAMSLAIGASAMGGRTYTATASQGLLFMVEAVYNAAGLGLPVVMTVANRAIGAPINIWNDHSDAMSQRDSGWVQLYAESNQAAVDLHVVAFRLAEELSVPVMVCMDGFVLTHAMEPVDIPDQSIVDAYLPPYEPRQVLDPADPVSIGAMVGPEAFTEVRYLAHVRQLDVLRALPRLADEWAAVSGRRIAAVEPYPRQGRLSASDAAPRPGYGGEGADTVVVALGSVLGTVKDTVDALRADGVSIGVLGLTAFRPFPTDQVAAALADASRVVVLERAFAPGVGGIVSADVRAAVPNTPLHSVVAGLGGRPVTSVSLRATLLAAVDGRLTDLTFQDLDHDLVDRELGRARARRRSGPVAENILADLRGERR